MGTVTINVGATGGQLNLLSGNYFNDALDAFVMTPNQLIVNSPEPGTLLLLATGLTGLAIQGRRRES
jgi:hypothetical protein